MNILKVLMGNKYPKFETSVCADSEKTTVTVHRTLSPNHVNLDSSTYVETKFKKHIPILKSIWVSAAGINEIAEDRLSEPEAIKNIGLNCKPFICTDNEPEETQASA